MIIFFSNCKKDFQFSETTPKLSIESAQNYFKQFNSKSILNNSSARTDESISYDGIIVDWDNAKSYFNPITKQSIVEAPILSGIATYDYISDKDVTTLKNFTSINNKTFLLVALDELGTIDFSIMKIGGTVDYYNLYGYDKQNSYYSMDPNFEGLVSYVTLNDSILEIFMVDDNLWYPTYKQKNDSIKSEDASARIRIYCSDEIINVNCPCKGHSPDEAGKCKCSTKPYSYTETNCYPVDGGGGPLGPPNTGGNGGNTGGSNGGGSGGGKVGGGQGGSGGNSGTGGSGGSGGFGYYTLQYYLKECNINTNNQNYKYLEGQVRLLIENYQMTKLLSSNGVSVDESCIRKMLGLPDLNSGDSENADDYSMTAEEWEDYNNSVIIELDDQNTPPPIFNGSKLMCPDFLILNRVPKIDGNGNAYSSYGILLTNFKISLSNDSGGDKKYYSIPYICMRGDYNDNMNCIPFFKNYFSQAINKAYTDVLSLYRKNNGDINPEGINLTFQTSFRKFLTDILNINCDTKPVAMGKYFSDHSGDFYIHFPNGSPTDFNNTFNTICQ